MLPNRINHSFCGIKTLCVVVIHQQRFWFLHMQVFGWGRGLEVTMEKQILFIFCHWVPEDLWFFFASSHLIALGFTSPRVMYLVYDCTVAAMLCPTTLFLTYTKQCHDMWLMLFYFILLCFQERDVKFFTETEENNQMRGPRTAVPYFLWLQLYNFRSQMF